MKFKVRDSLIKREKDASEKKIIHRDSDVNSRREEHEHLFALLVIWPLLWGAILYLLCKLGIFCVTDFFAKKTHVSGITQVLNLEGDYLSISNGNQVDLSAFHDKYEAGIGLELVTGNKFQLKKTGVKAGNYGGSSVIPVITVDEYGRLVYAGNAPINLYGKAIIRINDQPGPNVEIQGTKHQIVVTSADNLITIATPQDIDVDSSPTFAGLHLTGPLYDKNNSPGSANYILISTGDGIEWVDADVATEDDQTLSWDPTTFTLSIENGNSVDLSELESLWKEEEIGGYYSTDVLSPKHDNVQRIYLGYTGWGLTELQIKNEDNSNNYSGAVLTLKGSGPDYTNNMFFAKLGDNYYVPSWAGKGVVSTDQPLIIASVKSNDPAHPNNNPYIMFQTGGYYTAPVDRMILDSNGNLGIGNFSPLEKLTVQGNLVLTDSARARIYSSANDLEIGTTQRNLFLYSLNNSKVYLGVDKGGTRRGFVYVGTLSDPTSQSYNPNKLFLVVSSSNTLAPLAFVRYSNNNAGPVALYYKARGTQTSPQKVQVNDVLGGYNSLAYTGNGSLGWQLVAQLRHRVQQINGTTAVPYLEFKHRQPDGTYKDVARMLYDGRFGIGNIDPVASLDLTPIQSDNLALRIRSHSGNAGIVELMEGDGGAESVRIKAPLSISTTYSLTLPSQQGGANQVLTNDGSGNLNWGNIDELLALNISDKAVLYSDGTKIAGDPVNFVWDYNNNRLGIGIASPAERLDVVGNERIAGDIYPANDNTYSLGNSSFRWKDLYLGPGSLHIGDASEEGVLSYSLTDHQLNLNSQSIAIQAPNNVLLKVDANGITLDVGTSTNTLKIVTSNIHDGSAEPGDVLSLLSSDGSMDYRKIIEVEAGEGSGQLLYWDNTEEIYKHTLSNSYGDNTPFLTWDQTNGRLYIGQEGTLQGPDEVLNIVGNIHFIRRANHTTNSIYGVNKNNFLRFSSRNGSPTILQSIGAFDIRTYGSSYAFRFSGDSIRYSGPNTNNRLLKIDLTNKRILLMGDQTYNHHVDGLNFEILGMQPNSASSALYGGNIKLDGGPGRDSLEFESGHVYLGSVNPYSKIVVGKGKAEGKFNVYDHVITRVDATLGSSISATSQADGAHGPSNSIDDNHSTAWATDGTQTLPQSVTIVLSQDRLVDKVKLYYYTSDSVLNDYKYSPRWVGVEVSTDGTTWTRLTTAYPTSADWAAGPVVLNVPAKNAYKYYRIVIEQTQATANGSTDTTTGLYEIELFYISSEDDVRTLVVKNGNVGIRTSDPQAALQVGESGDGTYAIANDWQTFSDIRLKKNIRTINNPLDKILRLRGVYYRWKNSEDNQSELGFIAQEVQPILPEVVRVTSEGYLTIDYSKFTPLLVEGIKAQQAELKQLKQVYESKDRFEWLQVVKGVLSHVKSVFVKIVTIFTKPVRFLQKSIFEGDVYMNSHDVAGHVLIKKGENRAFVRFKKPVEGDYVVNITPTSQVRAFYYVEKQRDGFWVILETPIEENVTFDWVVFRMEKR